MPATAPRVLTIEDDPLIRHSVAAALRSAGYVVLERSDGTDLPVVVEEFRPDLVILDVMLPGPDGFSLARYLRRVRDLPVVFLTARDGVPDRLAGFELGGEDYVVKPFVTQELLARVRAILRRLGRLPETIDLGALIVDEGAGAAIASGIRLELTGTEWRLLLFLARHRGRVLSKAQLLTQVWGYEAYDENLVEVHVSALRRKLEAHLPRMLHTVRGLGYVLEASRDGHEVA